MSEEEKQAIESLKKLKIGIEVLNSLGNSLNSTDFEKDTEDIKAIDIVVNLVEKQQKEIEELKEKNKQILGDNIDNFRKLFDEEFSKRFISKDKIREKLDYQYELWNTPNRQKEYNLELAETLEELLEGE